jgi:hypothetical protein
MRQVPSEVQVFKYVFYTFREAIKQLYGISNHCGADVISKSATLP